MLELIARLRALAESEARDFGETPQTRGMHDLLLAMEERVETMRITASRGIIHRDLWERA